MEKTLSETLAFARAYRAMGEAVAEQIDDLIEHRFTEINPNAVDVIEEYLGGRDDELDAVIAEYREWVSK